MMWSSSLFARRRPRSRGIPAHLPRRPVGYRPRLVSLEDRLPLGDTVLSTVLGSSLLGSSLAVVDFGASSSGSLAAVSRPAPHGPAQPTTPLTAMEPDQAGFARGLSADAFASREDRVETPRRPLTPFGELDDPPSWPVVGGSLDDGALAAFAALPVRSRGLRLALASLSERGATSLGLLSAGLSANTGLSRTLPQSNTAVAPRQSEPVPSAALALPEAQAGAAPTAQPTRSHVQESYGRLPLSFEPNYGQTDAQVQFLSRGPGYTLFLTATEAIMVLNKPAAAPVEEAGSVPAPASPLARRGLDDSLATTPAAEAAVMRMQILGGNAAPQAVGQEELPGKVNYFLENDPARWHTNVPSYAKVQYQAVYPGVDLVYYGNQRQLEYDFVVAPGADPSIITLGFTGADQIQVDGQGDLVLSTGGAQIRQHKPVVYQEVDGVRQEVACGYVRKGEQQVGFEVAGYDRNRPLVIDPVLLYSTYLGGTGVDFGLGITVDTAGNAYVTGYANSVDFPTTNPVQPGLGGQVDVYVAKLNGDGSALVYSTYLGGGGVDAAWAIALDAEGDAYVTGQTASMDFPTANPLQPDFAGDFSDSFVTKLNPDGSALVYSTYLGGNGFDAALAMAVDAAGNAYVTGQTDSANFPTANPLQPALGGDNDAYVAKLNADGTALVYATYLGGSNFDDGEGIAVDSSGDAYVTGATASRDFPTANPLQPAFGGGPSDSFVTKLNADATSLDYSTYLGGSGSESGGEGNGNIAVDMAGNAYVMGATSSPDFPTTNALQPARRGSFDAFVAKLTADGMALVYATYLGGSNFDDCEGIAVDTTGNAYLTGDTHSTNFPTVNAFQPAFGGGDIDAWVAKLNADGSALVYSSYLGGSGTDGGRAIAVDGAGNAYLSNVTGSLNFPTTPGAFQPAYGGGDLDAYVAKVGEMPASPARPGGHGAQIDGHGGTVSPLREDALDHS